MNICPKPSQPLLPTIALATYRGTPGYKIEGRLRILDAMPGGMGIVFIVLDESLNRRLEHKLLGSEMARHGPCSSHQKT